MQPSVQQSAASAHIDDLVSAARSYRLATDDRPRRRRSFVSLEAVRSVLTPSVRKAQHA